MLQRFTDCLRAPLRTPLSTLRGEDSALAQGLALAQSYLERLQARLEDRCTLHYRRRRSARPCRWWRTPWCTGWNTKPAGYA